MTEWLLDTTYILPYFGIDVKLPEIHETLRELQLNHAKSITISSCSLIEGKWKAISLSKKENNPLYLDRANKALLAFGAGKYFSIINSWFVPDASSYADEILKAGHKDYMDCWIAGTAKALNFNMVSQETALPEVIESLSHWNNFYIFKWDEFVEEIMN